MNGDSQGTESDRDPSGPTFEAEGLRRSAVAGVRWTGGSAGVTSGLQLIQLSLLAHLLNPADFGIMSMAMVVIGVAQAFSDVGVSNAVVQRLDATPSELSGLYWLNISSGLVVFVFVVACSPLIGRAYGEPGLIDVMIWVAMTLAITPIGHQFQMLMQRELQFDRIAGIEIASVTLAAVISVLAALRGQGVFSLVWGQLASAALKSLCYAGFGWRRWPPVQRFQLRDLKSYLGFGLYQMGERSINSLSANVDYVMIGRFLGPQILGVYTIAYRFVMIPLQRLNPIVTRVAFPVFTRRQGDDAALQRGYLEMVKILAVFLLPILIGMGITAPLFVPIALGEGWGQTVVLIQVLVFVGLFKVLGNPIGSILLAKGRVDIGFKLNILVLLVNALIFWFLVERGVLVISVSYGVLSFVYLIIGVFILRSLIGLRQTAFVKTLLRPSVMAAGSGALSLAALVFLRDLFSGALPTLGAVWILGGAVYFLMGALMDKRFLLELWNLVVNRSPEVKPCQDS